MLTTKIIEPNAASIVRSMRDIGYTLNTAISDIIDNSIAAKAKHIDIVFDDTKDSPHVMIIDDGYGMKSEILSEAMRFAYIDPSMDRGSRDLGRFGLGLKTATFSHAKRLTVITKQNTQLSVACWDLDVICASNKWLLELPSIEQLKIDRSLLDNIATHGTIVLWEKLDRLNFSNANDLPMLIENLRDHLSIVFHKFLEGKGNKKLSISVNHVPIEPFDPFLLSNDYTKSHPKEKIYIDDSIVTIQAHILPHHSKLRVQEEKIIREKNDLLNNQGFYVYRNQRLMVWGDWFKLAKKSDKYKLARVEIHFDKELDHAWEIDIKKSKALPPPQIRQRLKEIINKMLDDSAKVQRVRVRKSKSHDVVLWQRVRGENRGVSYVINENYPLVLSLVNQLTAEQKVNFQLLMQMVSTSLPYESIYGDLTDNPKNLEGDKKDLDDVYDTFQSFIRLVWEQGFSLSKLLEVAIDSKLFIGYENKLEKWINEYDA